MRLTNRNKRTNNVQPSGEDVALGIDIGTSYSRAALIDGRGVVAVLRDEYGDEQFPTVVRYTMRGSQAGYYPERFMITDAENSVREVSRFLGRYADLPPRVLQSATSRVYEKDGRAVFDLLYGTASAEDVYSRVVAHLATLATRQAGKPVRSVVVTVPANAEDRMRVAVREAVEAAGLRLLRIANQPTAALIGLRRLLPGRLQRGTVAVVDVGGGSTDVSIARLDRQDLQILATAGDAYLGGVELRRQVAEAVNGRFKTAGSDLLAHRPGHSRAPELALLRAADEAIIALCQHNRADVIIDHGAGFGRDLWTTVTQQEMAGWIAPSMDRLAELCATALRGAGLAAGALDGVVLCGGGALNPAIRRTVAVAFGVREADLLLREPLGLAARGAAIIAGIEFGWVDERVSDVTPHALGIAAFNAPYPDGKSVFCPIIMSGTPIPTGSAGSSSAPTELFYTRFPYQTELQLRVLQYRGAKQLVSFGSPRLGRNSEILPEECEELGEWTLRNIQPRHSSEVEVTFSIDGDGILHLEARERGTRNVLRQDIARW